MAGRIRFLRALGRGFHALTALVALGILALIVAFIAVVLHGAWQSVLQFGPTFLTSSAWDAVHNSYGAAPAVAGTLLTSGLALLIAVPVALGVAIFVSEIGPKWLRRPLGYTIDLGAAVPSVVYGFWAFFVLVPVMKSVVEPALSRASGGELPFGSPSVGQDLFTATIVLAVMILPTIAAVARESLRAVPRVHRESALSLGATRWEATRIGVLRSARTGIVAGIILGLGRALGEAIAVAMVIGNAYFLPGTLFSPGVTLASSIVSFFPGEPGLNRSAVLEMAFILLAISVVVNAFARGLVARWTNGSGSNGARPRWRPWSRAPRSRAEPARAGPESRAVENSAFVPSAVPGLSYQPWRVRVTERAPQHRRRRRAVQLLVVGLTVVCVIIALSPFVSVLVTAVQNGGAAVVRPSFYTSVPPVGCNARPGSTCSLGGIGPQIQGTLIVLAVGALIAVPVGLLAGIYLAEYGRNRFARAVSFLADVMTGVPTIIIGVFVFTVFLYVDHDSALSALSAGVGLGILMIPIAVRTTEEALRAVPTQLRESALALGFPRYRVALRVVLGCARGGIVTGMLLAASRAVGDTAVLLLLTGNVAVFWFQGLASPVAAMTPFIFNNFGSSYQNLQTDAWGAALVLLGIMLAISLGARLLAPGAPDAAEIG